MNDRELARILELPGEPTFTVENGRLGLVNEKAAALLLRSGDPVEPMLATGAAELAAFSDGCLCLTVCAAGRVYPAAVERVQDRLVFFLEDMGSEEGLGLLALAAQKLRAPLGDVMAAADGLFPTLAHWEDPGLQEKMARMNRGLYQLLRLVSNLSDAQGYLSGRAVFQGEATELGGFFGELLDKAGDLGAESRVQILYAPPKTPILGRIDRQKMERAVYNLLANALRAAPAGSVVRCSLGADQTRAWLTVSDQGGQPESSGDPFARYRREPAVDGGGLGLGLPLARQVAALHGGALLLRQGPEGTTAVLSMALPARGDTALISQLQQPDYAGCRDHCLLELAEVLPLDAYAVGNIN